MDRGGYLPEIHASEAFIGEHGAIKVNGAKGLKGVVIVFVGGE